MVRSQQKMPPDDEISEQMSPALCGLLAWHGSRHSSFQAGMWASLPESCAAFGRTKTRGVSMESLLSSTDSHAGSGTRGLLQIAGEDAGYWNL